MILIFSFIKILHKEQEAKVLLSSTPREGCRRRIEHEGELYNVLCTHKTIDYDAVKIWMKRG
jgi:hypothetical protein